MQTKRIIRCALFACIALIIFVLEAQIPPPVAIPGVKLGLANMVTLASLYILGARDTFFILIVRIFLGNLFTGQAISLLYSLFGGVLCFVVSVGLKRFFSGNTIWALGVIGALFHNIGQIVCAVIMFKTSSLVYYGLVLCLMSLATGSFTGLCAQFTVKLFNKLNPFIT